MTEVGEGQEGDAQKLRESQPHQAAVEAPDLVEEHVVPDPEVGDEHEAGQEGEHPGPALEEAPEQVLPVKVGGRLGEDQLHRKECNGDGVDAVGEEQQAMEAQVQFGSRHCPLPSMPLSSSQQR